MNNSQIVFSSRFNFWRKTTMLLRMKTSSAIRDKLISIRTTPASARAVASFAAARGETLSQFARKALAERIERLTSPANPEPGRSL